MMNDKLSTDKRAGEDQIPVPTVEYIYGYDGNMRNNLFVLNDDKPGTMAKICYTAGNNIVFYELKDYKDNKENRQTYIHGTVGAVGISCVQLSPSKKYPRLTPDISPSQRKPSTA